MSRNVFGWDYPAGAEHDPRAPWNEPPECEACDGEGVVTCSDCDGAGMCETCSERGHHQCRFCNGSGRKQTDKESREDY